MSPPRFKRVMRLVSGYFERAAFLGRNNPRLLMRKIIGRIRLLLPVPRYPVVRERGGVRFSFDCRYDRAVAWMYRDVYEMEVVDAMERMLQEGDTFIDVGANIGYLSSIAAAAVGRRGHVHAFEPVPEYFGRLSGFARMNPDFDIVVNKTALGDSPGIGVISVSDYQNIGWNTMVRGLMADRMLKEIREVTVERLDAYIGHKGLGPIALIKIDTEGYELPVLTGLEGYLSDTGDRPALIVEVNPAAYPLLGGSLTGLRDYLERFGYRALSLIETGREIDITRLSANTNVLCVVRDRSVPSI